MTNINYNEFQPGQGVSAPALNENFNLMNDAIENMELKLNASISSITSTTTLKADKNGSSAEKFYVAEAVEETQAVNLKQLNSVSTLVGTIIWYAGTSAPEGYLICNGANVSRTTYADLFNVIGVKYGAGNSTTTFTLPNLISKFAEGATVAGTYKSAGLPNITGSQAFSGTDPDTLKATASGAFSRTLADGAGNGHDYTVDNSKVTYSFDASRSSSIYGNSTTVQPASLTLLPCIKY